MASVISVIVNFFSFGLGIMTPPLVLVGRRVTILVAMRPVFTMPIGTLVREDSIAFNRMCFRFIVIIHGATAAAFRFLVVAVTTIPAPLMTGGAIPFPIAPTRFLSFISVSTHASNLFSLAFTSTFPIRLTYVPTAFSAVVISPP